MATTTANEMAKRAGVDPQRFRQALRDERFPWHFDWERWQVEVGSERHQAMERILVRVSVQEPGGEGRLGDEPGVIGAKGGTRTPTVLPARS